MFEEPLTFDPLLVDKPWGGDRLARFGHDVAPGSTIGESWEIADLEPEQTSLETPVTRVRTGPQAGRTVAELIAERPEALLGDARPTAAGRFPLLVKLLDAREALSVQIHPPTSLDPSASKTESWIVLDAEPGSTMLLGIADGVTRQQVLDALGSAALIPMLREVPARSGDIVHLPGGTIHALGAGVVVAEVQTTSDTTYRVWDWPDERDGGRPLHVDDARKAVEHSWGRVGSVTIDRARDGVVVACDDYVLEHTTLDAAHTLPASTVTGRARLVLVVGGELRWAVRTGDEHLSAGGVALLPAACDAPLMAGPGGAAAVVATPR